MICGKHAGLERSRKGLRQGQRRVQGGEAREGEK